MYCPKCSQAQISDETRFCSRCGFRLNVVKALLLEDNSPPALDIQSADASLRKRDLTVGVFLMSVLAFIGALITIDWPAGYKGRLLIIVLAWFGLSLLINIKPIIQYFLRSGSPASETKNIPSPNIISKLIPSANKSLTEKQSIPAKDLMMPSLNTGEMAQPLSITEPTTNLLNQKE